MKFKDNPRVLNLVVSLLLVLLLLGGFQKAYAQRADFSGFYNSLPSLNLPIKNKNIQKFKGRTCDDSFFHYDFDKTYFTLDSLKVIGKFEIRDCKFVIYNFSLLGEGEGFEEDVYLVNAFSKNGDYLDNQIISGRLGGEGGADILSGTIAEDVFQIPIKEEYYESSTGLNYVVSIEKEENSVFNFQTQKFEMIKEAYVCEKLNFNLFYSQIKNAFKNSNTNSIVGDYSLKIKPYLYCMPLSEKNVTKYSDIAQFFNKSGALYDAIYIWKAITEKYPVKNEVWLNLANAQWDMEEYAEAKKSYLEYYYITKEQNGEADKIPEYVYERMKD